MQKSMSNLRLRAIQVCGSVGGFAKAMNWSPRKASYVTSGRQELTAKEIEECAEVLRVENANDFMHIFFPQKTIRWTGENQI